MKIQTLILTIAAAILLASTHDCVAKETKAAAELKFPLPATDDGLPGAGPIRRYDWMQNVWERRRTAFATNKQAKQGAVVFLGDSITQGWGDDFRGAFGELNVANRGISGDTTRGMLIRLEDDVLNLNPAGVVMLMGTNDLEEAAEPATTAGNVELILVALHKAQPSMPVVICNVFPSHESKKRTSKDITELNRLYGEIAKEMPHVTVVDTWSLFANPQGDASEAEFPDLLHPNAVGYAKWRAALIPALETIGLIKPQADDFEIEPGFRSLFNGVDLTGWGLRPTTEKMLAGRARWQSRDPNAPAWPIVTEPVSFDGLTSSPDGRYVATNGRLVVTTPSEGRRIQQLWTTEEFPNDFELRLQFRAMPNADSGVFIRDPQLQCRDYWVAGPYKNLKEYRPQDWNDLVVVVAGNQAVCTCNGEPLEFKPELPATGPIGLEGDRGQIEYRRIRIHD